METVVLESAVAHPHDDTTTTTTADSVEKTFSIKPCTPLMDCKLFVGNLHPSTSEGDLIKLFQRVGKVQHVNYLWHKSGPLRGIVVVVCFLLLTTSLPNHSLTSTGRPRGFAFVEMSTPKEALKAIACLSGKVVRGNHIIVAPSNTEDFHCTQPWYRTANTLPAAIVTATAVTDSGSGSGNVRDSSCSSVSINTTTTTTTNNNNNHNLRTTDTASSSARFPPSSRTAIQNQNQNQRQHPHQQHYQHHQPLRSHDRKSSMPIDKQRQQLMSGRITGSKRIHIASSSVDDNIKKLRASLGQTD
jgi:RNA recognition motif-containing protein